MKKGLIFLTVVTLLLALLTAHDTKESIVICSMMDQQRNRELQEQLQTVFPGKNVIVTYMSTGKAAAKVYTEGAGTEIDILLAMESGYLEKIREHLADISGLSQVDYLPEFAPECNHNRWVTWEKFAGAIVVNREVLRRYGLEAPRGYEDLLKPEYQGLVAMPDPKSSSTGYFFLKSWVNTMGEEGAFAYVDRLHGNIKQFTESGNGPTKMLKQGEAAAGLAMTFQAVQEMNRGLALEIIFPEEGSPYSLSGTAMLAGREQDPDVREVFEFLINDFFVYDKENFSPEQICSQQVNRVPNYPQNIQYADMTGIQDESEKERLLALWKY